jgi:hypothetical protein
VVFLAIRRSDVHVVSGSGVFFTGVFGVLPATVFGVRRILGMGGVFTRIFLAASLIMGMLFVRFRADGDLRGCGRRLDGSRIRRGHRFGCFARMKMAVLVSMVVFVMRMFVIVFVGMLMIMMDGIIMMFRIAVVKFGVVGVIAFNVFVRLRGRRRQARMLDDVALDALATAATARVAVARTAPVGTVFGFFLGFAMGAFVGFDQRLTIGDRNLVIIRMNFAEGQKAVAVAAVLDEGRLQRRLYARDLGEIDVAAELFALRGLEIKFFDAIAADHNDPGLFRVGGIDQHFVGHFGTLDGGGRVSR